MNATLLEGFDTAPTAEEVGAARRGRHRAQRRGRLRAVVPLLLVVIAVLVGAGVLAEACGLRLTVIQSGSMTPTLQVGDVVVSRPVAPMALHKGDVVTFHSGSVHGALITHRVVSIEQVGNVVHVQTKGDANATSERWQVPASAKLGLGVFHLHYVGRWLAWLSGRWVRIAAIIIAAMSVTSLLLLKVWRSNGPATSNRTALLESTRRRSAGRNED